MEGSFAVEARGLGILPEGVYVWDNSREVSWLGPRAVALYPYVYTTNAIRKLLQGKRSFIARLQQQQRQQRCIGLMNLVSEAAEAC